MHDYIFYYNFLFLCAFLKKSTKQDNNKCMSCSDKVKLKLINYLIRIVFVLF